MKKKRCIVQHEMRSLDRAHALRRSSHQFPLRLRTFYIDCADSEFFERTTNYYNYC